MPAGGTITAINEQAADQTDLVNTDPYGNGWLIKIELSGDMGAVLDADAYAAFVDTLDH
jgi:glycine cleavage system H protein